MPVIKSAIKKDRADQKKTLTNDLWRLKVENAVRTVRKSANAKNLQEAFSVIDKAAKNNIFHKNTAARMKSQISRLVTSPATTKKATSKKAEKSSKTA